MNSPIFFLYSEFNLEKRISIKFIDFEKRMQDISYRETFFNKYNKSLNLAKNFEEFNELFIPQKIIGSTLSKIENDITKLYK